MIDYSHLYRKIESSRLKPWLDVLPSQVEAALYKSKHGDLEKWLEILRKLPEIKPSSIDLNADSIRIGQSGDCDEKTRAKIEKLLFKFHPWRKGPFSVFGIDIETEWRSDMKWDRLKDKIRPLAGKIILDVGCGSGYHLWRMLAEGAKLAVGVDPMLLYVMQFYSIQHFVSNHSAAVLPIGVDELPENFSQFDAVFSMGVLYHRKSPFDHLIQLKSLLRDKGELVLETLIIDGKEGEVLVPEGRYAKMNNVWFIPAPLTLEAWLKKTGFKNISLADVTETTGEEQRVTKWMGFESLNDFLDPQNPRLTVEGYPRPKRAIFLAEK